MVAPSVDSRPISMLVLSALHMLGSAHGCSQLSRVKVFHL